MACDLNPFHPPLTTILPPLLSPSFDLPHSSHRHNTYLIDQTCWTSVLCFSNCYAYTVPYFPTQGLPWAVGCRHLRCFVSFGFLKIYISHTKTELSTHKSCNAHKLYNCNLNEITELINCKISLSNVYLKYIYLRKI